MARRPLALLLLSAASLILPLSAQAQTFEQTPHPHQKMERFCAGPDPSWAHGRVCHRHYRWTHPATPAPAPVASVPAPDPAPAPDVGATGGTYSIPSYIVACESGGSYTAQNPSGAYGAYQIMPGTAAAYGCDLSTPAGQDECAGKIYADSGASAWSCG